MANVILGGLCVFRFVGDMNVWFIASGFASIVITVMGVLHLKERNNDSFGNSFLSKFFSLGWVVTFRMLVMTIPAGVAIAAMESIVGGDDTTGPVGALFAIAFEILYYWWLGLLIAEANEPISKP